MTAFPYTFFENKFTKIEDAKLSIMTNCIQYGTGVIGGIRGYFNKDTENLHIFRLEDHYRRFLSSLKLIDVTLDYDLEKLIRITLDLIEKNKPKTDIYIRPYAYAPSQNLQPNLAKDHHFAMSIYMIALGEYLPLEKGLSVTVSAWRRISDNAIPSRGKLSGGYISSAMATADAAKRGFDEAIMLTENGHVAEGSAENIFIVRNGVLITPGKSEDLLEGITRRSILEMAQNLGIPTEERIIDRTELYISDEVFFTGTGAQISWIREIDGRIVGEGKRGPIATKLHHLFFKIVRGEEKKYQTWTTTLKTK